jgi:hypothetical protein
MPSRSAQQQGGRTSNQSPFYEGAEGPTQMVKHIGTFGAKKDFGMSPDGH